MKSSKLQFFFIFYEFTAYDEPPPKTIFCLTPFLKITMDIFHSS